eukprot:1536013-Heterocapsa_arctica.AAC.1
MECVLSANVDKKVDYNTFGGNVMLLKDIKQKMNSEPHCLWTTGVIPNKYTTLPDTEQMRAEDT